MSRFTGPLVIEEVRPGRTWKLREPILFEVEREGSGRVICVPAGFETDGASIPWPLSTALAVWGTYGRAACLHDYLYSIIRSRALFSVPRDMSASGIEEPHAAFAVFPEFDGRTGYGDPIPVARRAADRAFLDAMLACGTAPWLCIAIWLAVRAFGSRAARRTT